MVTFTAWQMLLSATYTGHIFKFVIDILAIYIERNIGGEKNLTGPLDVRGSI